MSLILEKLPVEIDDSSDFYPTDPVLFRESAMTPDRVRSLILTGPCQPGLNDQFSDFPANSRGRKFKTHWYYMDMDTSNPNKVRNWLIYSPRSNKMYCFYCWLMLSLKTNSVWGNIRIGISNFKKGIEKIKLHEESGSHREMQNKFVVTKLRLIKDKTIIHEQLRVEIEDIKRNREALKRIIDVILFLGKQNIPLRGHKETSDGKNKGNFIEFMEFLKKYDVILADHMSNAKKNALYTSPQIQNEILNLLGQHIRKSIVTDIIRAKYFTLIVDSTIDISKKDQMSLSIRYVNEYGFAEERFLKFIDLPSASADTFYKSILTEIATLKIDISLCRGQAYDGASTMSGCIKGLQTRIKEHAPQAIYIHCVAHKLNLCLVESISSCTEIKLFFGTLEQLYVFITESLPRLKIFERIQKESDEKKMSLKKLSTTRWASHSKAVNSVFQNVQVIIETLENIVNGEITLNARQMAEANGLLKYVKTFEFVFMLIFWKDVLGKIYSLSNYLQKVEINLNTVAKLIKSTIVDLKKLRGDDTCFNIFESDAKQLARRCGISDEYFSKRHKKVKHFHDEKADANIENCPRKKFQINVIYVTLDTFIQTLTERFEDFLQIANKFICLEADVISSTIDNINCLKDLSTFYKSDINDSLITDEYKSFCALFQQLKKEEITLKTDEILPYLISNKLESSFPNIFIIYKIYLTIATNSSNAERSFNRLKNIKTYNRSTMTEQRLNDIAILNIECDYVKSLDLSDVLDKFKSIKTRRIAL